MDYQQQAIDFLQKYNIEISINFENSNALVGWFFDSLDINENDLTK